MVVIGTSKYLEFLSKFGVGGAHPGGFDLTKEIFMTENINETSTILDVGCGTGQTAAYLAAQYGAKVTAIDINPIMVEKAKYRMNTQQLPVKIFQGSIEECPFEDSQFDFIISESVLAFANKPRALKEIFRLLKNSGRFIANEFTINHPLSPPSIQEVKQFYGLDSVLMENEWVALLDESGFKNIQIRMQKHPASLNNPIPEFLYSEHIEPELYTILIQHFDMMTKYQGTLDYRVFTCTK